MKVSPTRQTGITTNQMLNAPKNAFYVWCNSMLSYPRCLAVSLKRDDLKIVSPSWLRSEHICGWNDLNVIIDHAAYNNLSLDQWKILRELKERNR